MPFLQTRRISLTTLFEHTARGRQIEYAKKIGLGEDSYELVTI